MTTKINTQDCTITDGNNTLTWSAIKSRGMIIITLREGDDRHWGMDIPDSMREGIANDLADQVFPTFVQYNDLKSKTNRTDDDRREISWLCNEMDARLITKIQDDWTRRL